MLVYGRNIRMSWEIRVVESIFSDKCATGNRINIHTVDVQTLLSQNLQKMVSLSRSDCVFIGKRLR